MPLWEMSAANSVLWQNPVFLSGDSSNDLMFTCGFPVFISLLILPVMYTLAYELLFCAMYQDFILSMM